MIKFFMEGGWAMWPVLAVGMLAVASAGQYATDREPVRLRFIAALALAELAFSVQGMLLDAAKVLSVVADPDRVPDAQRVRVILEGLKESMAPGILGLGLLGVALALVALGAHRVGRRELNAARG